MNTQRDDTIFWRVDAENDFMDGDDGALPVGENQESEAEAMAEVTEAAEEYDIRSVYTRDLHTEEDDEIVPGDEADFKDTYPMHCERGTEGSEFIDEVVKTGHDKVGEYAREFDFQDDYTAEDIEEELQGYNGDILIDKNRFNVFEGSGQLDDETTYADKIVEELDPEQAIVDGVATDVCVDQAVNGLLEKGVDVYVVEDATKGIAGGVDEYADQWQEAAEDSDAEFDTITADQTAQYAEAV